MSERPAVDSAELAAGAFEQRTVFAGVAVLRGSNDAGVPERDCGFASSSLG